MLISGHLWLLCSKHISYVLKSHKWPHVTIFHQNLIARCWIPIVKGNWLQLFDECLIFDPTKNPSISYFFCSNFFKLVYFWTKVWNKSMGCFFPLNFNHWFQIWSQQLSNLINKCFSSLVWRQYFIRCITKVCNIFKTSW